MAVGNMAVETPKPLSAPRIYLIRMAVFLILAGFLAFILYRPIWNAFLSNPGLNGLIVGVLLVGIILAIRQVARLFREVRWVNSLDLRDGAYQGRAPVLLAPIAQTIGRKSGNGEVTIDAGTMRTLLDTVGGRLDESREIVRYLAGLLILLGLLGTFWGLIETVGAVGRNIAALPTGGDAAVLFDELKNSLSAPLIGIGIAFSSSLFGLGSSLVVGFLDLQAGQAQSRFFTELEDYLTAHAVEEPAIEVARGMPAATGFGGAELARALDKLTTTINEGGGGRQATQAMANLAEGIQGLVQHMRSEQQMIRDWVEAQATREKELKAVLERLSSQEKA
ncbi:MAG: flagellar motor protein MotA [Salinarimonas sp.]